MLTSKTEIKFLNTAAFKVDKKLQTKVYLKPAERQSYLPQTRRF